MNVQDRLLEVALERGLRRSTLLSYRRLLNQVGLLDEEVGSVTREGALEALWTLQSPNTRRSACIALRAVLGLDIRVPKGVPKRYVLPSEDDLRLACMCSPHETRLLLLAYCGLRVSEAAAITGRDVHGDRLTVDKQVSQLFQTGQPTTVTIGPVKSREDTVILPQWLAPRVLLLEGTTRPDILRESLRRAGHKVGLSLSPHQLRHWYATELLARGVPLITVSRAMRHSDVTTTLRVYAQSDDGTEIHRAFG
jgi:integrase